MAVYVTVVDPTSKKSPLAWVLVKDWTSQLSSAEGSVQVMSAPTLPGVVIDTDVGTHTADRRYFIICDTDRELRGAYVAMNVFCCVLHDSVRLQGRSRLKHDLK